MNIGSTHAMSGRFEAEALSVVVAQTQPIVAETAADVGRNADMLCEWMDRAAYGFPGFDLFVTGESCLQGFGANHLDLLIPLDGSEIGKLRDKCRELNVYGVFNPFLDEVDGKKACNTAIIIDNRGNVIHKYVKMNSWTPAEAMYPGWSCPTTEGPKGSKIATIICADGDYPEVWREAASGGANIIVRIAHYMSPWENAWEITNKAGAYFNQIYVVACNTVGLETYSLFGRSMILNPDGTVITEASMGTPWLIKADLYPQIIDHMRKETVTSNYMWSYRHRCATNPNFPGVGDGLGKYTAYR